MVRQIVWYGAIAFLGLLSSFYLVPAASETLFYWHLQKETPATITEWRAKEGPGGYFYPYALFSYQVEGKSLSSSSFYKINYARNPYALEPTLIKLSEESLTAYYDTDKPTHVSLEKDYPYKEWLKGIIAFAVAAYFFVLKRNRQLS